jgi:hypothetical protein
LQALGVAKSSPAVMRARSACRGRRQHGGGGERGAEREGRRIVSLQTPCDKVLTSSAAGTKGLHAVAERGLGVRGGVCVGGGGSGGEQKDRKIEHASVAESSLAAMRARRAGRWNIRGERADSGRMSACV